MPLCSRVECKSSSKELPCVEQVLNTCLVQSLFPDVGDCSAIAPHAALVRALSLHENCLQVTSSLQTCPHPSSLPATLKRTLSACLNTAPTPTTSSPSSSMPTSSMRPAGTTSSSR